MKSPFTGGNVEKKFKSETYTFRNEKYTVKRYYFQCVDTGKTFSNSEVDDMVMEDLYSQYRERHNIPSPAQLKELREKYGFSAHTMSKIAGIGINQYSIYENGEMPTIVVGQKLSSLFDKATLLKSIESSMSKLGKDYGKVKEKVESYTEPYSLSIEREYYSDFDEIHPLIFPSLALSIRRPQWAYCQF
jgi:transcriptional regulator with XRE-family HTH domain